MKHVVEHDLGQERATEVTKKALESYANQFSQYKPTANWVNDNKAEISFSVKGVTLKGGVEVKASSIELELNVPFLFRPFKGTALGYIEKAIQEWIGKAKEGKL